MSLCTKSINYPQGIESFFSVILPLFNYQIRFSAPRKYSQKLRKLFFCCTRELINGQLCIFKPNQNFVSRVKKQLVRTHEIIPGSCRGLVTLQPLYSIHPLVIEIINHFSRRNFFSCSCVKDLFLQAIFQCIFRGKKSPNSVYFQPISVDFQSKIQSIFQSILSIWCPKFSLFFSILFTCTEARGSNAISAMFFSQQLTAIVFCTLQAAICHQAQSKTQLQNSLQLLKDTFNARVQYFLQASKSFSHKSRRTQCTVVEGRS